MTMRRIVTTLAFLAMGLTMSGQIAWAAGGGGGGGAKKPSELIEAEKAIEAADYRSAIGYLEKVVTDSPDNADAFNYLGYSYRKLGDLGTSKGYYEKALALDPEHRGAHEYIGELYLQLGDIQNAEAHLESLDKICFFGCDEYYDLKKAVQKYKAEHQG